MSDNPLKDLCEGIPKEYHRAIITAYWMGVADKTEMDETVRSATIASSRATAVANGTSNVLQFPRRPQVK